MGTNNAAGTEGVQELNEPVSALLVHKLSRYAKQQRTFNLKLQEKSKKKKGGMQENNLYLEI